MNKFKLSVLILDLIKGVSSVLNISVVNDGCENEAEFTIKIMGKEFTIIVK